MDIEQLFRVTLSDPGIPGGDGTWEVRAPNPLTAVLRATLAAQRSAPTTIRHWTVAGVEAVKDEMG